MKYFYCRNTETSKCSLADDIASPTRKCRHWRKLWALVEWFISYWKELAQPALHHIVHVSKLESGGSRVSIQAASRGSEARPGQGPEKIRREGRRKCDPRKGKGNISRAQTRTEADQTRGSARKISPASCRCRDSSACLPRPSSSKASPGAHVSETDGSFGFNPTYVHCQEAKGFR